MKTFELTFTIARGNERAVFSLPVQATSTEFAREVVSRLLDIPGEFNHDARTIPHTSVRIKEIG